MGILTPAAGQREQGYRLAAKGMDTYNVLVTLQDRSDNWLSQRYRAPVKLIHKTCGKPCQARPCKRDHLAGPVCDGVRLVDAGMNAGRSIAVPSR